MRASYQEMFDEVRASERLKEEVRNMTKQERTQVVKKVSISFVIAAALAVILAGTALAAAIGVPQTLQEWFGKRWTEAGGPEEMPKEQAEMIESLVQPVGVTATNQGVSITLDSVTPSEGTLRMLLKVKGEGLKKIVRVGNCFVTGELTERIHRDATGRYTCSFHVEPLGVLEDGTQVLLLTYSVPGASCFLQGGDVDLRILNIFCRDDGEPVEMSFHPFLEGEWNFSFTLEPVEQTVLTVESAQVTAIDYVFNETRDQATQVERSITITDLQVTSTGFSYVLQLSPMEAANLSNHLTIQLEDGVKVFGLESAHSGFDLKRQGSWEVPIDLSKVEALYFNRVEIPLEQPKE